MTNTYRVFVSIPTLLDVSFVCLLCGCATGNPKWVTVHVWRSEVNPVNLVSLLPGSMDPAPTIGFTCPAVCLASTLHVRKERKRPWLVAALTVTQKVMLLCSVNPGHTDAEQGGLQWAWPSACLESSLQWGHYSWSKRGFEVAKVYSTHVLNQAWVSTLQPPAQGSLLSPPLPPGNSKRGEFIHLEKAQPKHELWSPRNQSPGLSTLIHSLLLSRK